MQDLDVFESADQHELEELSEAVRDEDALRARVILPSLASLTTRLAAMVEDRSCVGLIIFDGTELGPWERQYGSAAFRTLIGRIAHAVDGMRGSGLRRDDILCIDADEGESVIIFLTAPRDESVGPPIDFENVIQRLKRRIFEEFTSSEWWYHHGLEQVGCGSALILRNDSVEPRRELYRAIRKARIDAHVNQRELARQRHRVVGHMISQRKITSLYQPIIDLMAMEVVGYEALSRADAMDADRLGVHLFVAAARADLDNELDQTCRTLSIRRRPALGGASLFVNTLPQAFYEPMRDLETILSQWEADGLSPSQLVFEITENTTLDQLRRILPNVHKLKERGYRFAVDDVGTGTSNLQLIADLEPAFIKMDISLTRGISTSTRKQALALYLLELAERCDAKLIAEGIESQADMDTLLGLRIPLGQGFLLGRPQPMPSGRQPSRD
jgi:EAL domain-containing protein (putative c-di-GMP-specific phosphodiesterase class I)